MKKLAIFVEGLTEAIILRKLIAEIAGRKNIQIDSCELRGGNRAIGHRINLKATDHFTNKKYYALIIDCGADNSVASDIKDNYETMCRSGFHVILGLRDIYPLNRVDISRLRRGFFFGLKTKPLTPHLILAIMEIEAWFIGEYTHFSKLDQSLTVERINRQLGFDPVNDDLELLEHPSANLHDAYQLVSKAYRKNRRVIQRTANLLDFDLIYLEVSRRFNELGNLTSIIDHFLS